MFKKCIFSFLDQWISTRSYQSRTQSQRSPWSAVFVARLDSEGMELFFLIF